MDNEEHQEQCVLPVGVELQVLHQQGLQSHSRELEASTQLRHREDGAGAVHGRSVAAGI